MGGSPEQGGQLHHLTGARCLCSIWIVCGHFVPVLEPTVFGVPRHRGNIAVDFFIVMSGFITHWAYASRIPAGWSQVRLFYVKRVGRVVLTTWVAMAMGLVVVMIQLRGRLPDLWHLVRCASFLEPWIEPLNWCPNGQTWTVAALLPSWVLYPLTCRVIAFVESSAAAPGLLVLAAGLWACSFGPQLALFLHQGCWLTSRQGAWFYIWPPSQLPDFALGAVAAALALRQADDIRAPPGCLDPWVVGTQARGALADACVAVVVLLCLAAPSPGARVGWELLFDHGLAPLLAAFLYGSAAGGGAGVAARLLRHEALVALGAYSFEVYLFQWPVHEVLVAVGDISGAFRMRNAAGTHNTNSCGFFLFFLNLWLLAGLYAEFVEVQLIHWLRELASGAPSRSRGSVPELAAEVAGARGQ